MKTLLMCSSDSETVVTVMTKSSLAASSNASFGHFHLIGAINCWLNVLFSILPRINFAPLHSYQTPLCYAFFGPCLKFISPQNNHSYLSLPLVLCSNCLYFPHITFPYCSKTDIVSPCSSLIKLTIFFFCPKDRRVLFAYQKLAFPQGHTGFAFLYSTLTKVSALAIELAFCL